MSLSAEKLLLPDAELTALKTALANAGYPDAIPTKITEEEATVTRYTSAYTLATADKDRLARPLVIYALYSLIGAVSAAAQKARDDAMAELKDIRDGKFPGLTDSSGGTTGQTGGWGSKTKINFPGDE